MNIELTKFVLLTMTYYGLSIRSFFALVFVRIELVCLLMSLLLISVSVLLLLLLSLFRFSSLHLRSLSILFLLIFPFNMAHLSIYLQRISSTSKGTIGRVTIPSTFEGLNFPLVFHSLEPAKPALSTGTHRCVYAWSNKFNKHMCFVEDNHHVGIMFHKGNFVSNTKGCVLLGSNSHDYTLFGSSNAVNKFNDVILPFISNKDNVLTLIVR